VICINGKPASVQIRQGYAFFENVRTGDVIDILLDEQAHFLYPSSKIAETTGCVAIQRGPLVYCFEGVDNDGDVLSLSVDTEAEIQIRPFDPELLAMYPAKQLVAGSAMLDVKGFRSTPQKQLYSMEKPEATPCTLHAVPYYTWGNRGENQMRVWMTRAN
jgi:DUF1680 family protein